MPAPVIGITPDITRESAAHGLTNRLLLNLDYAEAIAHAGGIPVVLPPVLEPARFLESLDGILLTGGGDIAPHRYGAPTIHPATYGISDVRDEFEIALVHAALNADVPLLAICRGMQVLNVALGGTLIQHIPDEIDGALNHRQQELGIPSGEPAHPVTIRPDSLLARIVGTTHLMVNSYHHQAVAELASPLLPTATAPDGVVEAAEIPGATFVLAVQWHPERLFQHYPAHHALFAALIEAAQSRAARRATVVEKK